MIQNNAFSRTENDSSGEVISGNMYNLIIGLTLCWGFGLNWLIVKNVPTEAIAQINPFVFIIGYMISCFVGIMIYSKSDNPFISFIGYNFIVIPFGFVINIVVSAYNPAVVLNAVRVTGLVTLGMMILGSMYPAFFKKISGALTISLIVVIIVELIEVFFLKSHTGVLDWIVAVIFCGYIGYDWGRANSIPKTVDNAVDSAATLYIDIINLFLRILRIMGRKK